MLSFGNLNLGVFVHVVPYAGGNLHMVPYLIVGTFILGFLNFFSSLHVGLLKAGTGKQPDRRTTDVRVLRSTSFLRSTSVRRS